MPTTCQQLVLAFPAAAGSRGGFCIPLLGCRQITPTCDAVGSPAEEQRAQATISEKENTMTYTKPEVEVLEETVRVIEIA